MGAKTQTTRKPPASSSPASEKSALTLADDLAVSLEAQTGSAGCDCPEQAAAVLRVRRHVAYLHGDCKSSPYGAGS